MFVCGSLQLDAKQVDGRPFRIGFATTVFSVAGWFQSAVPTSCLLWTVSKLLYAMTEAAGRPPLWLNVRYRRGECLLRIPPTTDSTQSFGTLGLMLWTQTPGHSNCDPRCLNRCRQWFLLVRAPAGGVIRRHGLYLVGEMERHLAASVCRREGATLVAMQYEVVVHEQVLLRLRNVNGGHVQEIYADMFWVGLQLRLAVMEHMGLHPTVVDLSFAEDDDPIDDLETLWEQGIHYGSVLWMH